MMNVDEFEEFLNQEKDIDENIFNQTAREIIEEIKYINNITSKQYLDLHKEKEDVFFNDLKRINLINLMVNTFEIKLQKFVSEKTSLIKNLLSYINNDDISVDKNELLEEILNEDLAIYRDMYLLKLEISRMTIFMQKLPGISCKIKNSIDGKQKKSIHNKTRALDLAKKLWKHNPYLTKDEIVKEIRNKFNIKQKDEHIKRRWLTSIDPAKSMGIRRTRKKTCKN